MSTNCHGLNGRARTQFKRGEPRPAHGGRKKGTPNRATQEVRELAQEFLSDPAYRQNLMRRCQQGKLAPAVEVMLWQYGYGKPADKLEVTGSLTTDPSKMSDEELTAALASALDAMRGLTGTSDGLGEVDATPAGDGSKLH